MPYYPQVRVYIDLNNDDIAETDISAKVCTVISLDHGMFGAKASNRTPSAGKISFSLRNDDGYYEHAAQLLGKWVSLTLTFGGVEKQIFYGYILDADIDSGQVDPRRVAVTVTDWLYTASNTRVRELAVETNKRADEALLLALGIVPGYRPYTLTPVGEIDVPSAHPGTDFDKGIEIFPNMFDSAKSKTKLYAELDKIVKSELGYLYMKFRAGGNGEILRMENQYARGSTRPIRRTPINYAVPDLLKYHGAAATSGRLKYHGPSATSGFIKIAEAQDASFNSHFDAGWNSGKMVINDFSVTNTPRTNQAGVVLYTLGSPIPFGAGERKRLGFEYTNPAGGAIIQASGATVTSYAFNSQADGLGTDLTANFIFLQHSFPNSFGLNAENTGEAGYLITLVITGTGIFRYNPIEQNEQNEESQNDFVRTEISDSITREYSNNLNTSAQFAKSVIALRRFPTRDINWVSFHANDDEIRLLAFMFLEQGDKINISEIFPSYLGDYYIQGIKAKIAMGGLIDYTWYLEEEVKTMCAPIAVASGTLNTGSMNALDFGILPYLSNLPHYSYSMWIKRPDAGAGSYAALLCHSTDNGTGRRGNELSLNTNGTIDFVSYKTPTDGNWRYTDLVTGFSVWRHLVITYDNSTASADPVFWLDGTAYTPTEIGTPVGSSDDDSDCRLVLFNFPPNPLTADEYYSTSVHDVVLKDVRIYDRILSAAEIAELYAGQNDYTTVQSGLLFNGIYAPTDNIDDYIGDTLENDDLVLDIVHRAAGTPYSANTSGPTTMLSGEAI